MHDCGSLILIPLTERSGNIAEMLPPTGVMMDTRT